jgi:hypothetical protein
MYRDRLDGRIEPEFFDSHAAEWRREQAAVPEDRTAAPR